MASTRKAPATPEAGKDDAPRLALERDECVTASPESDRFASAYSRIRPRSADEIRELLGTPLRAGSPGGTGRCHPSLGAGSLPLPEDLEHDDPAERAKARRLAYAAAEAYVQGASVDALAPWRPLIERWLEVSKALINMLRLADIDVADGATLTLSASTHALYANRIRLHGSGRIVCKGNVTIRASSVEGYRFRDNITAAGATLKAFG